MLTFSNQVYVSRHKLRSELDHLVNKPFSEAGVSEDNVQVWKIRQKKLTVGWEAKLRGQLWNFVDNLSAKGIILRYSSKPEKCLLIS